MAKYACRSAIICFFALFGLFTALTPVYGGGRKDPDLAKADELIAKREYNEASLILSDFARRNPEKFDQAQKRLRKIAQLREDFNRTAGELIDTLLNDPSNSDKIRALTRRLNNIENESSPLMANFVSRTQEIAQFNLNRNQLREILVRGREQLERGNCTAAIQIYLSGMGIMNDEFFAAGYGAEIERDAVREKERVNSTLASFQQYSEQMGAIATELNRAINSGELAGISGIIGRLTPTMDRFIALKQSLYASVNVFDRLLNEIRRIDPEISDRNNISFVSILINGPAEEENEGILGAFETYWKNSIGSCLAAITSNIERLNSASLAAFNEKNYSAAAGSLGRITSYADLTPQFFQKHLQFNQGGRPQTVQLYGNTVLNKDIPAYLEIRALLEANSLITQAANIAANQNFDRSSLTRWKSGNISAAEARRNEQQTRTAITGMQRTLEDINTRGTQANTTINNYHKTAQITNALTAIGNFRSSLTTEEQQSAVRYYSIAQQVIQDSLTARREQLERGRNFLNGQRRTSGNGSAVVNRYPSEALAEFTAMLTAIATDIQDGNTVLEQYRNEQRTVTSNAEISNLSANYQTAINELNNIRTQGLTLAEAARSQSALAETYRQEGERLFREAQTAYQNRNYETARENIQRASDRFTSSLEIQESAALRQSWDLQLVNLGQAIAAAEHEIIITEVRNLVNTARNLYFAGNFQQAEDSLVRARNRWRITNADENDEVTYWLDIVRNAMTADTGRVIPPTAPLYAEMSQLLSQAQKNFEEGVRHINSGRRTDGINKFNDAQKLTREVRLMFPVNQEAGILELRIEQFTDPAAFNAAFEQRIRTAIDGTKQRSIESFADLLNLAEINPNYPNMRNIIYQAEIDIGRRQPPPNPANIARSRELTASASRILEGNISTQYEVALTQIDQAITLNPDNTEATRVKDRLLNRMSAPGAIVLSREDEEDYQRALRELQAGNNLVAFALVERLMQNPRNRNITKLTELQRRIQQVL
jgi:hypothetical protein